MTTTSWPILCGIRRAGVYCHKPAEQASVQTGACGCVATTYVCDGHPTFYTGAVRTSTCYQCGARTTGTVERRTLNEGDLPDTPGGVIMGRWTDGREVPA